MVRSRFVAHGTNPWLAGVTAPAAGITSEHKSARLIARGLKILLAADEGEHEE